MRGLEQGRAPGSIIASALIIAAAAVAGAASAQPRTDAGFNPRAVELFERDWALMHWGVKYFDRDGDGIISVLEANSAALKFKEIADGDGDGQVTPYEYDRAREFIIARY